MKKHGLGWLTTLVIVSVLIMAGPSLISTAADVLDQRVSDLESRVTSLEATVAALAPTSSPMAQDTHTLTGELRVVVWPDNEVVQTQDGTACAIVGDWSGFNGMAEVLVRNEEGIVVATGQIYDHTSAMLILGKDVELYKFSDGCSFYLQVEDIPTAKFYTLEVEGVEIGTFPYADFANDSWDVQITIYHP